MDSIKSTSVPTVHGGVVTNPDGTDIGESLPTSGNNGSITITEVTVGTVTTSTIEKLIGATTYTKVLVEDTSTGVTTVSSWV
jgi:hypothetical protein